jgi:MFS family permease
MELPWGVIADRIGYRRTMLVCNGLYLLSKLVFWQAHSFGAFLLERLVLAVTISGLSGVDTSMLYLSCKKGESQRVFGVYNACGTVGEVFATLTYIFFIREAYSVAALATVISHALAFAFSFGLVEVHDPNAATPNVRQTLRGFRNLLLQTMRQPLFLLALLGHGVFSECIHMVKTFLNQPQYLRCGWSVQDIGWAFLALQFAAMLGVWSQKFTQRLGAVRLMLCIFGGAALGCLLLAGTTSAALSFGCILFLSVLSSLLSPLWTELQNQQVTVADRATQLSVYALFEDLTMAGTDYALCFVADRSLSGTFVLCAAVCIAGGAGVLLWVRTQKETSVAQQIA